MLITLLHKGQINIRFEVSSLTALGLVTSPWHRNSALINDAQLDFNNIVIQGAKKGRIWETASRVPLPIALTTGTPAWLPASAHRGQGSIHAPLSWADQKGIPREWLVRLPLKHLVPVCSCRVDPSKWNMLLRRPRSLHREAIYSGDSVTQHLLSSYMIQAPQEYQVLKLLQSIKKNPDCSFSWCIWENLLKRIRGIVHVSFSLWYTVTFCLVGSHPGIQHIFLSFSPAWRIKAGVRRESRA